MTTDSAPLLLIVDDSRMSRMMIRAIIADSRPLWRIIEAASGDEAVRLADEPATRYMDQGESEHRFRVMFASGTAAEHHLPRAAAEFLAPCVAVLDSGHPGDAPWERTLVAVSPATVMVTSVAPAQGGTGVVVRLQETAGRATKARLTCAGSDRRYGGRARPTSVTIAVTSRAGVTSNAGFRATVPGGATRLPASS